MKYRFVCLMVAPLLLAGCGDDDVVVSDDGREASGEVLEGSISDEMLPLGEVRSQAPLAEPEPGEGGSFGQAAGAAAAPSEAEAEPVADEGSSEPDAEPEE